MAKCKDLAGKKFGLLTVVKRVNNDKYGNSQWLCRCECGNEKIISGGSLRKGTRSCGCLKSKSTIEKNMTHNLSKTRLYKIWQGIKKRCYNKNSKCFNRYGGRGITVCDEWKEDFMSFYNWAINNGYSDDLSIDRIDNNGNYEPDNCRWTTNFIQSNNKRNNRYITYNNQTKTMSEWARIYNINYKLLFARLKQGWDIEKALTTKVLPYSECGKMAHLK